MNKRLSQPGGLLSHFSKTLAAVRAATQLDGFVWLPVDDGRENIRSVKAEGTSEMRARCHLAGNVALQSDSTGPNRLPEPPPLTAVQDCGWFFRMGKDTTSESHFAM